MTPPLDDTASDLLAQGRALRALACSILRGTDGADDVVQEAFAARLASERADRPGWIVRTAQNLARRRLRALARQRRRDAGAAQPEAVPPPDDVVAQVEMHRLVAEAVLQLGEPYRRAIVLRFWHDLPPRAIARQLGVPVPTVKTHLQRGLAELRQRLDRRVRDRRSWLAALAPIAHPQLAVANAAGAPLLPTAVALVAMNSKHLALAATALICLGVAAWQPWAESAPMVVDTVREDGGAARAGVAGRVPDAPPPGGGAAVPADAGAADPSQRTMLPPTERTCTVMARIVGPSGAPARGARLRLVSSWEWKDSPPCAAAADADGRATLAVPRRHQWIPYDFALADAAGFAVRELRIDADQQDSIADDRLDLGTLVLERGVAVRGRVVEADGAPLRARARLLAWDPSRSGSWTAMFGGRTVGFAEPGGTFELADRLAANEQGRWMLAAVSAGGVGWAELTFAAGQQHLDPIELQLLPGGNIDVQVVDPTGRPVAGARVAATPYFQPIGLAPMWEPERAWHGTPSLDEVSALFARTTDTDGHARFANLPLRQGARTDDANRHQRSGSAIIVAASKPEFVTAGACADPDPIAVTAVSITLVPQRRAAFHGTVADVDRVPQAGVTVRLNGYDVESVTDERGRYELPATTFQGNTANFLIEGGDVPRTFAEVELPADGDRITHDFAVELRAPVTGRVVDQFGAPVAGVALDLGVPDGLHYPSAPERTGADGRFAFPDAVASHTDLWVRLPEPRAAWRLEPPRPLQRRRNEVVTLQRLAGRLVDLRLEVFDGSTGEPVSPAAVELRLLHDSRPDYEALCPRVAVSLGAATAPQLRPGRYLAFVRAGDGRSAQRAFALPGDEPQHTERVPLWPTTTVVCTVDASALPADELARRSGDTALVLLDAETQQSQAVDRAGQRLNYTPNTGAFRFGGDMTFRLEGVTADALLRLYVPHDDLFGEAWFRAEPGRDAQVTLRLLAFGRLTFRAPPSWPDGDAEIDVFDDGEWRHAHSWSRRDNDDSDGERDATTMRRPTGAVRWRLRFWPRGGGEVVEHSGTATVATGATTDIRIG